MGENPSEHSGAGSHPGRKEVIWENVRGLLTVIVIFLLVRTFIIEAYRIPSGSMKPTLQVGDWLFVNKFIYGAHIPFTDWNLPGYREPQRGDVVVFISPYQADEAARGADPLPTLVKRLVGVAGDTLYMRDRILYRNGEAVEEDYLLDDPYGQDSFDPLFAWQHEYELEDSRFGPPPDRVSHDNWGPLVVPSGYLFMMGDHRYDSKDSRYWGIVPRKNVRGRPMFVYYSYNGEDSDKPLPAITDIRWGRIFHWIR